MPSLANCEIRNTRELEHVQESCTSAAYNRLPRNNLARKINRVANSFDGLALGIVLGSSSQRSKRILYPSNIQHHLLCDAIARGKNLHSVPNATLQAEAAQYNLLADPVQVRCDSEMHGSYRREC